MHRIHIQVQHQWACGSRRTTPRTVGILVRQPHQNLSWGIVSSFDPKNIAMVRNLSESLGASKTGNLKVWAKPRPLNLDRGLWISQARTTAIKLYFMPRIKSAVTRKDPWSKSKDYFPMSDLTAQPSTTWEIEAGRPASHTLDLATYL